MDKVETLTMTRCETMLAMANMLATQMDVDPWVVIAISKLWTLACGPCKISESTINKNGMCGPLEKLLFLCFFQMGLKQPSWDKQHGILNHQSLD